MNRPSWDETFMAIAQVLSRRSTCLRRRVGAILVDRHYRILGGGYNGAPAGFEHCEKLGCLREQLDIPSGERHEICRAVHAEINAILWARMPTEPDNCTLYVTDSPCSFCARIIAASPVGISRVVYQGDYPDDFARKIFTEAGIELVKFGRRE